VPCTVTVPLGSEVELVATANALTNSFFNGWGGACAGSGFNSGCVLQVDGPTTVNGWFAEYTYKAESRGELIGAIVYANEELTNDIIYVPAGTYTLDFAVEDDGVDDGLLTGLPIVRSGITIVGQGDATINRTGGNRPRLPSPARLAHGGDADHQGVTLRGGRHGNPATTSGGGAILAGGPTTIVSCTFIDNDAGNGSGGAIYGASGKLLTVIDSHFENNHADEPAYGKGGAIHANPSIAFLVTVTGSSFEGNSAFGGGAVYVGFGGAAASAGTIAYSTFTGNSAAHDGGMNGHGGALNVRGVILDYLTVTGNTARTGGGISMAGTVLRDSTISGNAAVNSAGGISTVSGDASAAATSDRSRPRTALALRTRLRQTAPALDIDHGGETDR
jgi:predicted outer membrane repeat protein